MVEIQDVHIDPSQVIAITTVSLKRKIPLEYRALALKFAQNNYIHYFFQFSVFLNGGKKLKFKSNICSHVEDFSINTVRVSSDPILRNNFNCGQYKRHDFDEYKSLNKQRKIILNSWILETRK